MQEKSLCSPRGRTYYWISKHPDPRARALVFLPGLTANHHLFDPQVSYFASRYSLLVWDAPAHGKSRPYRDFSYPNLARELKAILDREEIRSAVLIGQSGGGFAVQSFIRAYPHMAEGFVSIGSCPFGLDCYSPSDRFWLRQTEWMARLFPDRMLRRLMAGQCGATPQGRANMEEMLEDYSKRELCRLMYLGFAAFLPEIGELDIPCSVCLVVGERDRTGKVRRYNELWHRHTGYPLYIVPGAAHNANYDQPGAVNGIIQEFLRSL